MVSITSMTESFQASIAMPRQSDQFLLSGWQNHKPSPAQTAGSSPYTSSPETSARNMSASQSTAPPVGRCRQILLVMAVSGMEMCLTFEQIYLVLILQYLGVPLSMVSLNGVICGLISMTVIPIVGYVTDKGSNPKKRKMVALFIGMGLFQIGLLLLLIAGVFKIAALRELLQATIISNSSSSNTSSTLLSLEQASTDLELAGYLHNQSQGITDNNQTDSIHPADSSQQDIPITGYLAICGFAFVDTGFDSSMGISRAYILESVPRPQQLQILVMATIVQACSGTLFALLGVVNISDSLGLAFSVDGTSAILIFFCLFLFLAVTLGFVSTTVTGHFLSKCLGSSYCVLESEKGINSSDVLVKEPFSWKCKNSLVPADISKEENDYKKPLLLHDENLLKSYASNYSLNETDVKSETHQTSLIHRRHSRDNNMLTIARVRQVSCTSTVPAIDESLSDQDQRLTSSRHETRQNNSDSLSLSQIYTSKEVDRPSKESPGDRGSVTTRKRRKQLAILATSYFFTAGASMAFLYYAANAVTLGIFQGDPLALPNTEGKRLYDLGLRTASLGNLSFYILFTLVSLVNSKLIALVGERFLFLIFHIIFAVPLLALLVTRCLEAYFVSVTSMGVFRHTVYTLTFVMANKIVQENTGSSSQSDKSESQTGRVMALLGFLLPTHYILMSSCLAPLFQATGDVWIPLMYSLACTVASVLVFSLLFVLK